MQIEEITVADCNVLERFCVSLFNELNRSGIRYCILRGFESLPQFTSNDIDIGVDPRDVEQLASWVKHIASQNGWSLISVYARNGFSRLVLFHPEYGKSLLPIDLISGLSYRGLRYAELGDVLEHRQKLKDFFVAAPPAELGVSILGRCLSNRANTIKESDKIRYSSFLEEHEEACREFLSAAAGEVLGAKLIQSIKDGRWCELDQHRIRLLIHMWNNHGTVTSVIRISESLYLSLRSKLNRRGVMSAEGGMFVVLLGPDGSGKSTLAHKLIDATKPAFTQVNYFHGRFGVFPKLNTFFRIFKSSSGKSTVAKSKVELRYNISKLRANINVVYYGLEYFIGNWMIWKGNKNNELTVGDRYFYDYYLHPEYKNASQILIRTMQKLVPKPDVVFLVRCDPDTIFQRKQELTHDEILRQQDLLVDLVNILPNTSFVSTDCGIDESITHAKEVLFKAMLPKSKCL